MELSKEKIEDNNTIDKISITFDSYEDMDVFIDIMHNAIYKYDLGSPHREMCAELYHHAHDNMCAFNEECDLDE